MNFEGQSGNSGSDAMVCVRELYKTYSQRLGWSRRVKQVAAVQGVNFEIPRGSRVAVVGESGSGKSTLAACIAQLERPDSGEVWFDKTLLTDLKPAELAPFRRKLQLIFQDSALALNPAMTVSEIICEPLEIARVGDRAQRGEQAAEVMRMVMLDHALLSRSPMQLSGGQRQRVALARALMLRPELLILDEAFSGLDLIVQEQILELLLLLQVDAGLTYLVITHDLSLASQVATHVAIMDGGKIVEQGTVRDVLQSPQAARTRALLAAVPRFPHFMAAAGGQA